MNIDDFKQRWDTERAGYEKWGNHVTTITTRRIEERIGPTQIGEFLKVPALPRLKNTDSLIAKAFHRQKSYKHPYEDINDKVGVRFVVLLCSEIPVVEQALTDPRNDWSAEKDKDFEQQRNDTPEEFLYQSTHYLVRPLEDDESDYPDGVVCEVQIRTLLQHAHSELSHRTVYKPNHDVDPVVRRIVARSVALVETTDECFSNVAAAVDEKYGAIPRALAILRQFYKERQGLDCFESKSDRVVVTAFINHLGNLRERLDKLVEKLPWLPARIRQDEPRNWLFGQPCAYLIFLVAHEDRIAAYQDWPLADAMLEPFFTILGIGSERWTRW